MAVLEHFAQSSFTTFFAQNQKIAQRRSAGEPQPNFHHEDHEDHEEKTF
jgi:hypothetical protein